MFNKFSGIAICCLFIIFISCKKSKDNSPAGIQADPGIFNANVNGNPFTPQTHFATYVKNWKQLYITAEVDSGLKGNVFAGFNINPSDPLKTYPIEPNGGNIASANSDFYMFYSDDNVADAGGTFTLTKFDTVNHLLSGTLYFKAYTRNRDKNILFTDNVIRDIVLREDNTSYPGNLSSCSITGAANNNLYCKDVVSRISCLNTNGSAKTIEVKIASINDQRTRYLRFLLPTNIDPVLTYTINNLDGSDTCATMVRGQYKFTEPNMTGYFYSVTSGEFHFTQFDTLQRKIIGTYNVTVKNASRNETIEITNGELIVNGW